MKRIAEGELLEIEETGRGNINNNRVLDGFMDRNSTESQSRALAEVVDGELDRDKSWSQDPG